jgi:drug/metabolite transporter (DMT)-like permease
VRWNLALGGLAASWGFVAVLAASVDLGAESLTFWRLALATLTLAVATVVGRKTSLLRPRGRLRALVLLGVLQGAHWLLFLEAVELGSVALAVLTFYAAPLVIALAAPWFLGERTSPVVLGACLVGAVGIAAIALDEGGDAGVSAWAVVAGLGSAATYAALVIVSKRLLAAATPPLTVAFWDCLVGTLAVVPVLLLADHVIPADAGEWAVALALGVVFTGLSTLVYATLLRRVTAQAAGVLTFLEPVAGVLLAWSILEQRPGTATLVGGVLVLSAGIAVVLLEPADARVAEAPAGVGSPQS